MSICISLFPSYSLHLFLVGSEYYAYCLSSTSNVLNCCSFYPKLPSEFVFHVATRAVPDLQHRSLMNCVSESLGPISRSHLRAEPLPTGYPNPESKTSSAWLCQHTTLQLLFGFI